MGRRIKLLQAVLGVSRLTRVVRTFFVPGKRSGSIGYRPLGGFRGNGFWIGQHMTALEALRRNARDRLKRRGEVQRMRRRPLAGLAV